MKKTKQFRPTAFIVNAKMKVSLMLLLMLMLVSQGAWAILEDSDGTKHITSASDFADFASNLNGGILTTVTANFKLDNDITLPSNWVAIGTDNSGKRFAGTFDGQGHTITFSGSSQGLFGCTDGATIQNVKLAGSISSGQDNTGSLVSTARGATKIYNVYSSVNITMTAAKNHIGGIAGQILQADGKTGEIKGCTYSGTMNLGSSTDSNGGIVGYCGLNANIEIENCFFSGSISSTGSNPRIGGILGYADDDGSTQNFKYIRNCYCDGTLSPSTGDYVGIFAGYPRGKVKDVITNNTYVSTASTNMAGNSTQTTAANNGCKKITISVTAGSNGTVSHSYVNPSTEQATQLEVVATPNEHYHLNKWSDNGAQTHNVSLTDKVSLTASFAIDQHTITVKANDSNMGTVSGGGTFDYNSTKTITATPNAHYHFVQWNDGVKTASRQITVTGNATYTATFEIDQHTITVQTSNGNYGTVTGGGTYNYGTQQTITATPKTGYHFDKWSDNNTYASRTITVKANATYTANFAAHTYGSAVWTWASDGKSASAKITCTACGNVLSDNAAMTNRVKTPATCTVKGTTTYTAKVILNNREYTATNDVQDIAVLGHDFTSQTPTDTYLKTAATCTGDAVYYHKCSRCDAKGSTTWTKTGSAGHDYAAEYTIDVEATCETAGSKSKHCSRCESKDDVQTILALGHDYAAEYTVDVEQTCVIDGVKSKHCSRCESKDDVQIIPASGSHTFAANDPNHTLCTVCNHGFIYYTTTGEDISIDEYSFPDLLSRSFDSETKRGTMEFSGPVTTIGTQVFYNCGYLKTVTLPQTLQSIERSAFWACYSLDGIELPSSIRTIGRNAFSGCSSLDGIELPSSIQTIGEYAFQGCASLTSIVIPEGVTSIGERTFAFCTKLESVTLPSSVTSIGENAFQNCTSLTGISSDYVTTIGREAFFWCTNLTTIHLPKVTTAFGQVFYECNKISEITVSCSEDVDLAHVPATATVTRIHLGYTEDVPAKAPTCLDLGRMAYTRCADFLCYNRSGDEFRIPALGHDIMTHHAAVASTCTTQGNEEYWTCSRDCCEGKYFMTESGYGVTRNSLPTLALASHQWGDDHACTECGHEAAIAHSGTWGTCTWTIYEDGFMLVKPTNGESGTLANWNNAAGVPWDAYRSEITSVKFQGEVIATSCSYMFRGCSNLTSIDFGDIYTGDATYMNNMFSGCTALQELDLSNFLTTVNTNFEYMFSDCPNLATLKLSNDFGIYYNDQNSNMFTNCGNSETKCKVYYVNDYSIKATIHNYWGDVAEFVESAIVKDGWKFENYNQQNIPVENVVFTRTFTPEKPATAMLPFQVGANLISGATFYEFKGVKYENGEWVATMQDVSTVQAYKPYVVITSGTGITFTGSKKVVFPVTPVASYMTTTDPETGWTFKALNNYKFWNSPSDSELGKAYGFAGKDKTVDGKNVHQGEFVKLAVGASAKPGRCYLVKEGDLVSNAKGMKAAAADELPSTIKVRFINGNDDIITGIATLDTETGQMSDVQWYDLNGKKIDAPTKRGIYIKNNKKVFVK